MHYPTASQTANQRPINVQYFQAQHLQAFQESLHKPQHPSTGHSMAFGLGLGFESGRYPLTYNKTNRVYVLVLNTPIGTG